jgi:hypothetical protein
MIYLLNFYQNLTENLDLYSRCSIIEFVGSKFGGDIFLKINVNYLTYRKGVDLFEQWNEL